MQYLIWELQYAQYTPLKQFFDRDTLVLGNAIAYKSEQIFKGTEIEFRDNLFYNSLAIFFKVQKQTLPPPRLYDQESLIMIQPPSSFMNIKGTI